MLSEQVSVPFVDIASQNREFEEDIMSIVRKALAASSFIGGSDVSNFESIFAAYCGSRHAIAVSNGTDALSLALRACGVARGDVVITVPNTFVATVEAIVQAGAEPRFVDVNADSLTMEPERLRDYLSAMCAHDAKGQLRETATGRRVSAIVPVHLYGQVVDMASITQVAAAFGVQIIEDACQAHGAEVRLESGLWRRVGTVGRAGAFSFYPAKNLGALGDAGAIVTDDADVASTLRLLRDHGQERKYIHQTMQGVNARMDAIQAAVLAVKLPRLDQWNEARRHVAAAYRSELRNTEITLPAVVPYSRHVYHLFVIRSPKRTALRQVLSEAGIETGLHYPVAIHLQPGSARLGYKSGDFPAAERNAAECLSLPMYPHLDDEAVCRIAKSLNQAVASA